MRAALCKRLDGPAGIVVEDVADPVANAGDVIVRVEAAALNFMDTLITRGKYQQKPKLPFSPSAEIAGHVEHVGGGIEAYRVGDRVAAFVGWGGACERIAVRAERLVRVPDGVSSIVAAGISVTYGTAMHGLYERGCLNAGEAVAVLGASGGAGLAAVEIARLAGARVIAVASSTKHDACLSAGADVVIDSSEAELKTALRAASGGRGIDIIYDCVGGSLAEPALRALAWKGRYLVIGFASGEIPSLPLNLPLLKGCDILGVNWPEAVVRDPRGHTQQMAQVLSWIADGALAPRIGATYPLERTADAITLIDQRRATGKVVIDLTA